MPDNLFPKRKRLRKAGYDYSDAGWYFVTICLHRRHCLLGQIIEGRTELNSWGTIVKEEWCRTPEIRAGIRLDEYVVMPNHLHGIIVIDYPWLGIRRLTDAKQSLDRIVSGFKGICTRRINALRADVKQNTRADAIGPYRDTQIWQRSYYDEIIRDEHHLSNIRRYIINNPGQWEFDKENPNVIVD